MKIQSLAIIFVIIILPISILLSEYTQALITTVSLQTSYNSSLISATYDAVVAYQLNSINDSSTDITNSKIRDIEASANTFLTSIGNQFKMSGESSKAINEYVPAIVFTMYDGYYIYSPYENDISDIYSPDANPDASYIDGERLDGLKPYVYYSCRYTRPGGVDVVITYSLDNYITIQGYVGPGNYWNKSGYFLDKVSLDGSGNVTYDGIPIDRSEGALTEQIYDPDRPLAENPVTYKYAKINGTKYYLDETDPSNPQVFYIQNGEKNYSPSKSELDYYKGIIENNTSAYEYYRNAAEFREEVRNVLGDLTFDNAVDENDANIDVNGFNGTDKIFDDSNGDAEEESSNFTTHRTAVIRYTIEKNLSIAIANYDQKFGGSTSFSMPNLSEEDWYKIINQTSVITFLQGLPMGTKIYNGYAVITNDTNKDVVTNDSIYIVTSGDNTYHRLDETDLENSSGFMGYLNIDFEKRTNDNTNYYYSRPETASYTSIVNQTGTSPIEGDIYQYLQGKTALAKAYYTALGRERYSMFRVSGGITIYPTGP